MTFLFTDIEGSTRLWEKDPDDMRAALVRHDQILRMAIGSHRGYVFSTAGDAFAAAFWTPAEAVAAAVAVVERLTKEKWPGEAIIRVRIGIHTGIAEERDGDYFGPPVNRACRLTAAGHGGQLLVSNVTAGLLERTDLVDLGEHRLKDLAAPERIWRIGPGDGRPLRTLNSVRHNLPVPRSELIGRGTEVRDLCAAARQHRLVSVLGIGGAGKTRLALAAAAELVETFPDGIWFVDLVRLKDGDDLAASVADAAGLAIGGASCALDELSVLLAHSRVLLLLDNCEHVNDSVADMVDSLLETTFSPHFLITSREPLDLPGEHQLRIPPLGVDDDRHAPAVALFAAAAANVGVSVTDTQIPATAHICRRLDGLPLALELAAAQLRQLSLGALAERLDRRFELLQRERRGRHSRQSSLAGVLLDTWNLLSSDGQQLLRQLAAFPASFSVDDVEAVAAGLCDGVAVHALATLVDRSLVVADGDGRLRLLETVKLFAQERWVDSDRPASFVERHTAWCLAHLRTYPREARHTSYPMVVWVMTHYDDVRTVEDTLFRDGRLDDLVDLLDMQSFTFVVGRRTRCATLIDRVDEYLATGRFDAEQGAVLRFVQSMAAGPARRRDRYLQLEDGTVDILRQASRFDDLAHALVSQSQSVPARESSATALGILNDAINVAEEAGYPALANLARSYRASRLVSEHRLEEATAELEALRPKLNPRELDYARAIADAMTAISLIVEAPERAYETAMYVHDRYAEFGLDNVTESLSHDLLPTVTASTGRLIETQQLVIAAWESYRRGGYDDGVLELLLPCAVLAWRRGHLVSARRWMTAIRRATTRPRTLIVSMYRQFQHPIGLDDDNPLLDATLQDVFAEACNWLNDEAEAVLDSRTALTD